jgi:hypothetical protein
VCHFTGFLIAFNGICYPLWILVIFLQTYFVINPNATKMRSASSSIDSNPFKPYQAALVIYFSAGLTAIFPLIPGVPSTYAARGVRCCIIDNDPNIPVFTIIYVFIMASTFVTIAAGYGLIITYLKRQFASIGAGNSSTGGSASKQQLSQADKQVKAINMLKLYPLMYLITMGPMTLEWIVVQFRDRNSHYALILSALGGLFYTSSAAFNFYAYSQTVNHWKLWRDLYNGVEDDTHHREVSSMGSDSTAQSKYLKESAVNKRGSVNSPNNDANKDKELAKRGSTINSTGGSSRLSSARKAPSGNNKSADSVTSNALSKV